MVYETVCKTLFEEATKAICSGLKKAFGITNWYVNNRCQDREKNSLPSIDSCPFLWTAHRFLPIEQNRVTPDDTVWSFNRFPSSWFYQRIYALETDSIIYSKIPFCRCDCYGQLVNQQKYAVTKIVLFGSRARGTNTERSDVDIAIYGGDFDSFYWDVKENIHPLIFVL